MDEKDRHIRQQPGDAYPTPEVPAESAWSGMRDMLDQEMPVGPSSNSNWIKIIKLLSALCLTSIGLIYFIQKKANHDPHKGVTDAPTTLNAVTKLNKKDAIVIPKAPGIISIKEPDTEINAPGKKHSPEETAHPGPPFLVRDSTDPGKKTGNRNSERITTLKMRTSTKASPDPHVPGQPDTPYHSKARQTNETTKSRNTSDDSRKLGLSENSRVQNSPLTPIVTYGPAENNKSLKNTIGESGTHPIDITKKGKITLSREKTVTFSKTTPADAAHEAGPFLISMLTSRPAVMTHELERKLKRLSIQSIQTATTSSKRPSKSTTILNNIHAGLLWNVNLPFSGYNNYFRGTNNTTDFYKTLIPGIWAGKTLSSGNEILIKVKPYSQQFGSNRMDTSLTTVRDTATYYYTTSRGLLKSSGFNLGIQYNQNVYNGLSVGLGANLQWQKNALLSNQVKSSRRNTVVDYEPFMSLSQKTDTSGYLKPYFFTGNLEVLYAWKKVQLGAGITVPITRLLGRSYEKQKPVSGQVTVRWWVR